MWRSEEGKLNINPLSPSLSSLAASAAIFLPLLYLYKKSGARGNNQNKLGHASSSSPPAQIQNRGPRWCSRDRIEWARSFRVGRTWTGWEWPMISEYGWAATLLIIYEDRNWENIIYLRARQVLFPIFGSYSRSRELFLLFVLSYLLSCVLYWIVPAASLNWLLLLFLILPSFSRIKSPVSYLCSCGCYRKQCVLVIHDTWTACFTERNSSFAFKHLLSNINYYQQDISSTDYYLWAGRRERGRDFHKCPIRVIIC